MYTNICVRTRPEVQQDESHLPAQLQSKRHRKQIAQLHEVVEISNDVLLSYPYKILSCVKVIQVQCAGQRIDHSRQIKYETVKNEKKSALIK